MRLEQASGLNASDAREARRGDLLRRRIDAKANSQTPKLQARSGPRSSGALPVYDGRTCIGRILSRGIVGFEALDLDRRSLGLFPTRHEAADAIEEARL